MKTHDKIISSRAAYLAAAAPLREGMFMSRTAALSEADMTVAKTVIDGLAVVKALWGGDSVAAIDDLDGHIDFEDGSGRFSSDYKPGLGSYEPDSTSVEFRAQDGVVEPASVSAYNSFDTYNLLTLLCGEPSSPDWLTQLNAQLREENDEFSQEETEAALVAAGIELGDYLGTGGVGPYQSGEFQGNDGLEYIETNEGMLIRIGRGYGAMDNKDWVLYSSDAFDTFLLTLTGTPSEDQGYILLGYEATGDSKADTAQAAKELSLLVEYGMLLNNSDSLPSDDFMDSIYAADRQYREEQGQTNLFTTQE